MKTHCEHEVPCTCDEFFERLTLDQLKNLRMEFGCVITDLTKYPGSVIELVASEPPISQKTFWLFETRKAKARVKKVNEIMGKKYGCTVI